MQKRLLPHLTLFKIKTRSLSFTLLFHRPYYLYLPLVFASTILFLSQPLHLGYNWTRDSSSDLLLRVQQLYLSDTLTLSTRISTEESSSSAKTYPVHFNYRLQILQQLFYLVKLFFLLLSYGASDLIHVN